LSGPHAVAPGRSLPPVGPVVVALPGGARRGSRRTRSGRHGGSSRPPWRVRRGRL